MYRQILCSSRTSCEIVELQNFERARRVTFIDTHTYIYVNHFGFFKQKETKSTSKRTAETKTGPQPPLKRKPKQDTNRVVVTPEKKKYSLGISNKV